jgi:hypothetical protein
VLDLAPLLEGFKPLDNIAPRPPDLLADVLRVHPGVVAVPDEVVEVPGPILDDVLLYGQIATPRDHRTMNSATTSASQTIAKRKNSLAIVEPSRSSASV